MHEALVVVVLALHLMCVNVAAGGPLVCLWFEWREGRGDALAGRAGRYLAASSLALFLIASALGLLVGALLWSPQYRDAVVKLGPRVGFGVWELAFSLVLMAAHVAWWSKFPRPGRGWRWARMLLPLASGTNLLYHFPFLFMILSRIAVGADAVAEPLGGGEFRARMFDGAVLSRTVHFWLSSLGMVGVVMLGFALRSARRESDPSDANRVARWGGWIAVVPTVLQIPVGMWVLLQLSAARQTRLMGGDAWGTTLLAVSLIAALVLMHQLASVAMGNTARRSLVRAMVLMSLVVLLMTGTSRRSLVEHAHDDTAGRRGNRRATSAAHVTSAARANSLSVPGKHHDH